MGQNVYLSRTHATLNSAALCYGTSSSSYRLNRFLGALNSSFQPPAMALESFKSCFNAKLDSEVFSSNVWSELDSLATGPLYACLQKVHVSIRLTDDYITADGISVEDQEYLQARLSQMLPRLCSKGILHGDVYWKHNVVVSSPSHYSIT